MAKKKLFRKNEDRIMTGLFGGLGEFFSVDPVVLRLLWLFVTVFTGFVPGLVTYLVGSLVVPQK